MKNRTFQVNGNLKYAKNIYAERNTFIGRAADQGPLPSYEDALPQLPRPFWAGHESTVACHDKAWRLAFGNLRKARPEAGFVSDFIDTAFNGYLFMWDSSFIVMFGKYASHVFDFQRTLDNFYSHQHRDGFICREIYEEEPGEQFTRDDPASTGPNVLPWAEWTYFESTGDTDRLSRVFDPLLAYHRWLRLNRSWPDGTYWCCGWSNGMDNSPRPDPEYDVYVSHGFMSWIDACAQQYLSADILIRMGKVLGREEDTEELRAEAAMLRDVINNTMWSEEDAFYYDRKRDHSLNGVKTAASYWTLLAGLVPEERKARFIAHLDNENEFRRPVRVPSLSADHPQYHADGGYWRGSVWAPTNYMILTGLARNGYDALAHEIALNYVDTVTKVFDRTGTVYENYAPEQAAPGHPAKDDFVGWTGLAPVSVLYEYVFGIRPDAMNKTVVWDVRLTEEHGIENYRLGDATLNLRCAARAGDKEKPVITVSSDRPVTVRVLWNGTEEIIKA